MENRNLPNELVYMDDRTVTSIDDGKIKLTKVQNRQKVSERFYPLRPEETQHIRIKK